MAPKKKHPTAAEIEETLKKDKKGRIPFWLVVAVVTGALIGGVVWWQWPKEIEIHWTTHQVERGDIVVSANATGKLQPRRTVTVGAEISGKIATVDVENNDLVEIGQVLATFDTDVLEGSLALARASLASSEASLRRAEASYAEAQSEEARTKTLVEREVVATAEAEAAQTRTVRAGADLDQARADLERSRAQVDDVRAQIGRSVITSPIDGVVLSRQVEPGQTVASSLQAPELFIVAEDLSQMKLEVWVDEADVGLVQPGQEATFEVSAWPGRTFDATVETLDLQPTLTDNVVTYIAQLSVENPEHLLRPGMTAAANIITGEQNDILRVPNTALRFEPPVVEESSGSALVPQFRRRQRRGSEAEGVGRVFILQDGEPAEVRVNTGRTDGRFTAIESDEITEGTQLVIGFTEGVSDAEESGRPGGPGGGARGGGGPR